MMVFFTTLPQFNPQMLAMALELKLEKIIFTHLPPTSMLPEELKMVFLIISPQLRTQIFAIALEDSLEQITLTHLPPTSMSPE